MKGTVRSFVSAKRFGFIDGEDGQSYFVHINDVSGSTMLTQGQAVEFEPMPTPRGLSAKKVKAGKEPEAVYVDPDKFIMTKSDHVKGCEIISIVGENCWGESNDPNAARELLKDVAQKSGANAVVCMSLDKYTKSDACSNYQYTMHRYYGHAVVVKRVEYTSDSQKIASSNAELAKYQSMSLHNEFGDSSFIKPASYVFYPLLTCFWLKALLKIILLLAVYSLGRCVGFKKTMLVELLKKLTRRSSKGALTRGA